MNILPLYENLTPIEQIESLKVNFSYILTEIIAIFFEMMLILGQKEKHLYIQVNKVCPY